MTYYSIKIFSVIISFLPRKLTIKIAIFLGTLINLVFPKRKQVAIKNLSIAFPNKSIRDMKNIIKISLLRIYIIMINLNLKSYIHRIYLNQNLLI